MCTKWANRMVVYDLWYPHTAGTRHRHDRDMDFTHKKVKQQLRYDMTRYIAHFEVSMHRNLWSSNRRHLWLSSIYGGAYEMVIWITQPWSSYRRHQAPETINSMDVKILNSIYFYCMLFGGLGHCVEFPLISPDYQSMVLPTFVNGTLVFDICLH